MVLRTQGIEKINITEKGSVIDELTEEDIETIRTIKRCLAEGHDAEIRSTRDGSMKVIELIRKTASTAR